MNKIKILLLSFLLNFLVFSSFSFSEIIKKIEITGNNRISDETILMFSDINTEQSVKNNKINQILKDPLGFKIKLSLIIFLNFSALTPVILISLISGASSNLIKSIFFSILTETLLKKFELYRFFNI